ncbi:hypothetical protein ONS95_001949 [Cadophora gregata]|uniref:uncharacterized protein n=1 Tax=Cadophora gregata TaxID=51156 RepID=UPI0026DCFAA1|nr:uncharacterized protein ONS95_001949 [Cadophora gregata]KAK0111601.1 hypothetical protein ONS95_001949 [Cadophora gregata]KAK0111921.1 hypothetical protein ONS96_001188 [Cadophora gregata f. sp. sojae]
MASNTIGNSRTHLEEVRGLERCQERIILLHGFSGVENMLETESFSLQSLEYYEGLMFLTTNRIEANVSVFDSAFDSPD